MPNKALKFCSHYGCNELTTGRFCEKHAKEHEDKRKAEFKSYDRARGSAKDRGYDGLWQKRSKSFLKKPGNQICKLHLSGCTMIATCVDHIDPPDGPGDPRFWDENNWQSACIHCNSVKGRKKIIGEFDLINDLEMRKNL